jgi:predicted porin
MRPTIIARMNQRRFFSTILFAIAAVAIHADVAAAQERGQIGLSMGYPGSIGIIWHVSDAVAVRPDFQFRGTSVGGDYDQTTTTVGVGISGLVYVVKRDALHIYVSPRLSYTRTTAELPAAVYTDLSSSIVSSVTQVPRVAFPTLKTTSTTKVIAGSFGAQYAVHKRFSVFGEAGFSYGKLDTSYPSTLALVTVPDTGPRTWGTQTAAGVVVYFKD